MYLVHILKINNTTGNTEDMDNKLVTLFTFPACQKQSDSLAPPPLSAHRRIVFRIVNDII